MSSTDRARKVRVLFQAQAGRCAYCGLPVQHPDEAREALRGRRLPPAYPTLDHVRHHSRGGDNSLGNLLLMHSACNRKRADGPLPATARAMRKMVLGWLELQYGAVPRPDAA